MLEKLSIYSERVDEFEIDERFMKTHKLSGVFLLNILGVGFGVKYDTVTWYEVHR